MPSQSPPAALAIAAHPDDIEFMMAGTLLLLKRAGWRIHYFNLSRGNLGSTQIGSKRLGVMRAREARAACEVLGATWHPPIANDLEIFYDDKTLRQVSAVVREVQPAIVLTHSPQDYMEDHMNTCRLAVSGAFTRGMPNYRTKPSRAASGQPVTVYHALPHGLRDGLRRRVMAGAYVNTEEVHAIKRESLACHRSQKEWLDASQGMDSYLVAMDEISLAVGKLSRKFRHAEGWRRHSHLGFCGAADDPLREALGTDFLVNQAYERDLG